MAMPRGLSAGRWAEFAGGLGWEAQRLNKHSTNFVNMPVCSAKSIGLSCLAKALQGLGLESTNPGRGASGRGWVEEPQHCSWLVQVLFFLGPAEPTAAVLG